MARRSEDSVRPLLTLLALLLAGCATQRIADLSFDPHFAGRVATDDGWEIAVFRVPGSSTASSAAHDTPVLLAHGTVVNRGNFTIEGSNLSQFLADRGFDVWMMEYRGDRSSVPPDEATWRKGAWTVDDIAFHDVPAAIDHVLQATGRKSVLWLGHSLGGVLGYITLQGPHAAKISGMVALSAPGDFSHPNDLAKDALKFLGAVPKNQQLPSRNVALMARLVLDRDPDHPLLHSIFDANNVDEGVLLDWIPGAMENVGWGVVLQYASWIESGVLLSADGSVDYTAGLSKIRAPMLFIAGRTDHIVPPWTVRKAYDLVSSTDKQYLTLGVGWGTRHEYGHGGLVAGDWAEEELFGRIGDWLAAHAEGPAPASGPTSGVSDPWGAGPAPDRSE
jgi:pimeloyl-ACP methyl ester carboxylesterase